MNGPDEYTMWLERAVTGRNDAELRRAYDELIIRVKRIDPLTVADTTGGSYRAEGIPRVVIPFLQSWFLLEFLPYRVRAAHQEFDTLPLKVLVLHHVAVAAENQGSAVRVMGKWVDIRSLQHGAFLGAHLAGTIPMMLGRFFALEREQRIAQILRWGGRQIDLADEGYLFHFFPRLPMALINWIGDEELPASSKVLYDVSASNYMPTHGIAALTQFLVHRLAGKEEEKQDQQAGAEP
ncbi:MAG: DUF3786 domain-containing protein [Pseudomonadota bacterium]